MVRNRELWLLLALFALLPAARAQRFDLISVGDAWRYLKGKTAPPGEWAGFDFDDAGWLEGPSGFGFGDDDDITILDDMEGSYRTVYLRRAFSIEDPATLRKLFLRASYDDGFVAYVNGVEVARRGLGNPGTPVHYDTSATAHEYGVMEEVDLSAALGALRVGRNVFAVEVHNDALNGNDLSFSPALRACGPHVALARGPYLQRVTESSALVVWRTDPPAACAVDYGSTEALDVTAASPAVAQDHAVELTGLAAGASCFYRVRTGDAILSPVHEFRPAPPAAVSGFRLAVCGDTEKMNAGFVGVPPLVEAMAPDLGLICGDVIRDGDATGYLFDPWRRVMPRCPLYAVPGNHDVEGDGMAYLDAFFFPSEGTGTERYYSFDHGNAHFVCLDVSGSAYARGSKQHQWLRADLAAADRLWKFVFLHEAPYSTGTVHGSNTTIRSELVPTFDEFKVDLVFSGHNHNFERTYPLRAGAVVDPSPTTTYTDPAGTIYVVTGGGGGKLYAQDPAANKTRSAFFLLAHHACQLDVAGATLTLRAIDLNGESFYTLTITKSFGDPPVVSDLRVEDVRATSARVVWRTDVPADSVAEFGLQGRFDRSVAAPALVTEHSLELVSLAPGKGYEVRIRSTSEGGGTAASEPVRFSTFLFFLRGDSNADGKIDLSDAVKILRFLFAGDGAACLDAADINDTGSLDLSDPIRLLGYLFAGGPPPLAPFPEPGDDPTPDGVECPLP